MFRPVPPPNPENRPPSARSGPRRRRGRVAVRGTRRALFALVAATLALAGCQGVGGGAPGEAWSEKQIAQVFDLSELGRSLTIAPSGDHLLLDGRALPSDVLGRFPHLTMGRSTNLLRFADDALAAMSPEAQAFVLRAAPGELRARLSAYGLSVSDLHAGWAAGGEIDLAGLRAVAARLDGAAGASLAVRGAVQSPGARLLADLGVAR
jgi:hypothetical protein